MLEKLISMNNVNVENIYGRTICWLNLDDKEYIVSNELKDIYNIFLGAINGIIVKVFCK